MNTASSSRRRLLLAGLRTVAGLSLATLWGGRTALAQTPGGMRFFQIGTGTTGGTYFAIGGLLANAISNPPGSRPCDRGGSCGVPGLIAVAQATSGAVENIQLMRSGRLESALAQADIVHAAAMGDGSFTKDKPFAGLRSIANLYDESIHLVVRADSGIKSVADLKGKRVGVGEEGSGTLVTVRQLFAAFAVREKQIQPLYISPGKGADRLAGGEADAFFIVGGAPLPSIADLAGRVPIALVPFGGPDLETLTKRLPFYRPTRIEEGVYQGVPATDTLAVGAQWVVGATIPEKLVHGITQALWHATTRAILDQGHPRAAAIRLETALSGLAVPLHPGAARYYAEAGLDLSGTPSEAAAGQAATGGPSPPVPSSKPKSGPG